MQEPGQISVSQIPLADPDTANVRLLPARLSKRFLGSVEQSIPASRLSPAPRYQGRRGAAACYVPADGRQDRMLPGRCRRPWAVRHGYWTEASSG